MLEVARRIAPLTLACSLGCGSPPPPPPQHAQHEETPEHHEEEPSALDVRSLAPDATFGELLDAARTLDDRRDQESSAGCLLRPAWRLEADLAVAVRPLPASPDDLDDALEAEPGPVNVLTRWGAFGSGDPAHPSFSAVTSTLPPRREPALVWVVTERGVYARSSREAARDVEPVPVAQLAATIPDPESIGALFVTAESGTPISRVADVLALVPPALAGRVALAVPLAPGTRLPTPPREAELDARAGLCPNGLPELPADAPSGDLRPDAIVQSLGPLRQGAETCVSSTQGPGALGGRVVLALRIGPDGRVSDACAVEDATNDAVLRECLLRAARATAFPAPEPPGYIDAQLPLTLAPLASQRQRPLCD